MNSLTNTLANSWFCETPDCETLLWKSLHCISVIACCCRSPYYVYTPTRSCRGSWYPGGLMWSCLCRSCQCCTLCVSGWMLGIRPPPSAPLRPACLLKFLLSRLLDDFVQTVVSLNRCSTGGGGWGWGHQKTWQCEVKETIKECTMGDIFNELLML